jgi:hypothetical protein
MAQTLHQNGKSGVFEFSGPAKSSLNSFFPAGTIRALPKPWQRSPDF